MCKNEYLTTHGHDVLSMAEAGDVVFALVQEGDEEEGRDFAERHTGIVEVFEEGEEVRGRQGLEQLFLVAVL